MQCADLYSEALSNMQVSSVKGQWDKGWVSIAAAKSQYFHAVAQQHLGLLAKNNKAFGESVARLKVREYKYIDVIENCHFELKTNNHEYVHVYVLTISLEYVMYTY